MTTNVNNNIIFSKTSNPHKINKTKRNKNKNRTYHFIYLNNLNHILRYSKTENAYIIFPLSIEDVLYLSDHKNRQILYQNQIRFLLSDHDIISILNNKSNFVDYMINHGYIDYIPKKYDCIQFPCILKRNISFYGVDSMIVKKQSDLKKYMTPQYIKDNYLIQEPIYGIYEYATHILAKDGIIILHCTYRFTQNNNLYIRGTAHKDHQKEKIDHDQNIYNVFSNIIYTLNYTGICCIDYKIENNSVRIFEINPRIGMSLIKGNHLGEFIDKYIELGLTLLI